MVLETRAETVTRLGSGETELLWGLAELAAATCGVIPFCDIPLGVSTDDGVSFSFTPPDMAVEGEPGLEVSVDLDGPG